MPAFSAALLAVLLSACAGAPKAEPPPAPPTVIQATIAVAADANPDAGGRASPVVVRLFELKNLATFEKADFFSLFEKGRETLGADLLSDEEFVLQPGESRRFERRLQDGALHVAVVAGFRDLDRSSWRGSIAVRARATTPVAIGVQQRRITISDK
ncbi:type VI secretion system lipoprotein TssJ [Pseudoduganella sp. SL102]|uniref:type VI secretion system lipoprotein TssJ n=1 Tax=Pseudoduganella sp. SL102 TaxID=2995154 RepID=UPI00248CAF09|nr:type VI secretion system lipoprotein TssJ [Pseudoduganella sp. SL102]WBS00575.1 type VI secretion system lipoprotein TssJ [Pseudoduganella sp. SL102]